MMLTISRKVDIKVPVKSRIDFCLARHRLTPLVQGGPN